MKGNIITRVFYRFRVTCKRLCVCIKLDTFLYKNFKDKANVDVSDLGVIFVHFKGFMLIC